MDFTLSGDYYQAEPSWVLRAEGVYKLLYVLDGNFRGTLRAQREPSRAARTGTSTPTTRRR